MPLSILYIGWLRLLRVYLVSVLLSFLAGLILVHLLGVAPEKLFSVSSTRISYVVPILDAGVELGADQGTILFLWNSMVAMVTILFFYAYIFFNPVEKEKFPKLLRSMLCGKNRMKLLCYLPGARSIEQESLRRLYVWLMIPMLGMMLLGLETGMMITAGGHNFATYLTSFLAFLPHGIIEIPVIAFAGSVSFSAHLLVKKYVSFMKQDQVFAKVAEYEKELPIKKICILTIVGLLAAGMLEAYVTPSVMSLVSL